MVATRKPINDPEIVPRMTFTGMNHLIEKKRRSFMDLRKDKLEENNTSKENKPLKHFVESDGLPELGKDQAGKQKREDQLYE